MKITKKTIFPWLLVFLIAVFVLLFIILRNDTVTGYQYIEARNELYSFEQNYVKVTIYLEYDAGQLPVICALFEPMLKGYHLYGRNTPKTGVDGIGRPTLIELKSNSSITARGEIVESKTAIIDPYSDPSLSAPLYIYPDGPVALRLPIGITATTGKALSGIIFITYMTCGSNGLCTAPVVDKAINITIPITTSQ